MLLTAVCAWELNDSLNGSWYRKSNWGDALFPTNRTAIYKILMFYCSECEMFNVNKAVELLKLK